MLVWRASVFFIPEVNCYILAFNLKYLRIGISFSLCNKIYLVIHKACEAYLLPKNCYEHEVVCKNVSQGCHEVKKIPKPFHNFLKGDLQ